MNIYEIKNENPQFIFLEKIKALFITIIEKEKIIKNSKINLSDSKSSNLMNFFAEIDSKEKGYIDVKDLENYLKNNSTSFKEQTIRRFIHLFDKHQKFNLVYDDFCHIFQPYNQLSENVNKTNINIINSKNIFLNILIDIFELIEQINEIIFDITKTNNFTSYEAFMGITKGNKYLDEEFMTHFLDHNYNGDEIKNLIYLMDLNNDSLISYEEFQDFFTPSIKYIENIDIINNFNNNDEILKENEKDEETNIYDSNNDYNYFENNSPEKNDNDIVNYEKSGKFRGNILNSGKKYNEGDNLKNKCYNCSVNDNKKYYNSQNLNKKVNKKISNSNTKINNWKIHYIEDEDTDKNYKSMNDLNHNKYNFKNYNYNPNELKNSSEEENNIDKNNRNEIIDNNNDNNENNNFENDLDNDYDEYCNFFRKTQKVLSSSSKKDNKKFQDNSINNLQKTPNFKNQKLSDKQDSNDKYNLNKNSCEDEFYHKNYGNNNKINTYKKIKKDNDYIINILDDNNIRENKLNNKLNVMHTEVQYLPQNKIYNILKIEKNADINLDKNKDKVKKFNFDSLNKEDTQININNFTCGGIDESEKENSSSKKINLSNKNNNNESYSLSNENNKISKNINISHTHSNSRKNDLENNVLDSFSDRINKETLKKKLKEYNNSSLTNFLKFIQFIVKNEKKTIDCKDKLCLREDITLKDLFCIFDYNKKNNISKREFKSVCKKLLGLYPTSDQIVLVFKRYDKNKDDNLNIKEFLGMIKPIKEEYASFLFNKKNNNQKLDYQQLSMKSKKLLVEVVKNIIEDEGNYYKFKDDMINQNLLDLKELWEILFKYSNNNKGLDKLEIKNLLMNNGFSLSQYDLDILFNKMDHDDDQILSYQDLIEEFDNYY